MVGGWAHYNMLANRTVGWYYASLVCLRLRFVIFASFEMVDFGFLWDLRADEYIQRLASSRCTVRRGQERCAPSS